MSLRRPSAETIREFLAAQAKLDFTYSAVGATASQPPAGYVVDHTRIKLGEGEPVFQAARAALQRWEQFRLGWLEAWSPETPIQTGEVVAIVARCHRPVVAQRLPDRVRRGRGRGRSAGSASPTARCPIMPGAGEERFLIEWDRDDDSVWYDILAFSRPHFLTRLGYPFVRRLQKRFGRESAAAMVRAVNHVERGSNREEKP